MIDLELAARDIRAGSAVADTRILALLNSGSCEMRFATCHQLALAYHAAGNVERTLIFAKRAYGLWRGEKTGFVDFYLDLLREVKDANGIREVAKRAGMICVDHGEIISALRYFNLHHYAKQSIGCGDSYAYDYEILAAVERLAGEPAFHKLPARRRLSGDSRIKVAYLVFGAEHTVSVLMRLLADFARYHDRERFDVAYFSPDADVPTCRAHAAQMRSVGAELHLVDSPDDRICLAETASALGRFAPDILVSAAALADYRQYYLFTQSPATARISLTYGPPAQFVPPATDWVISATRHTLIDSPCDGSIIELEATLPELPSPGTPLPEGVSIPDGAVLILACGRSEKFLSRGYWSAILEVLARNPDVHFVAFGLVSRPDFLEELLATDPGKRVQVLGWLIEYRGLLARADIVVDTYPSGGGLTIVDSMAFGIPVLAFSNNYLIPFDQTDWNPAEEIIGIAELIVPRGDMEVFATRLQQLVSDPAERRRLGLACQERIQATRGNPERMVRRIEREYVAVLHNVIARDREPTMSFPKKLERITARLRARISDWRARRWWRKLRRREAGGR